MNPEDSRISTCKKVDCFHAGFDAVFHTLSFDVLRIPSRVEGLKANPERRPERPESKPEGRVLHEAKRLS
jgi:hypothetical protein